MPFITEEIWQQLPRHGNSLTVADWPKADPAWRAPEVEASFGLLMELTRAARDLRSDLEIAPNKSIPLILRTYSDDEDRVVATILPYLTSLARASHVAYGQQLKPPSPAVMAFAWGIEVYLRVDDPSVVAASRQKLDREWGKVRQELARVSDKLSNADFLSKAPEDVVAKEQEKHDKLKANSEKLEQSLARLEHMLQ